MVPVKGLILLAVVLDGLVFAVGGWLPGAGACCAVAWLLWVRS